MKITKTFNHEVSGKQPQYTLTLLIILIMLRDCFRGRRWSADLPGSEQASLGLRPAKEQGQIWATNLLFNISQG